MADKSVPFFNPSDITGLGGDWVVQENGLKHSNKRASGLGATGDEAKSKLFGGGTAGPVVLECHAEAGNLSLPSAGSVSGGYHIDDLRLEYQQNGWPRLTLNLHNHDANAHAADDCRTYSATPTFPAQFGIPRSLVVGAGAIGVNDSDAAISSLSYSLGCTHIDEDNEVGNHHAGENHDGVERLSWGLTKVPSAMTNTASWDLLENGATRSNTTAEKAAYDYEHHVAADA